MKVPKVIRKSKLSASKFLGSFSSFSLFFAFFLCMASAYAQSAPQSIQQAQEISSSFGATVKVGFIDYDDSFSSIDDVGVKTGYAYEYLQFIAYNSGWRYEYVYGDFPTLKNKLENGEIDMMLHFFREDEIQDDFLFSDYPIGTESVFLFIRPENAGEIQSRLSALNGKTVGVVDYFYGLPQFKSWLSQNGFSCTIVSYSSDKEAKDAFNRGETDFLLYTDTHCSLDWLPVYNFSSSYYYIAMSKSSADLYAELNRAQEKMYQKNPNLNYMIYNNYYSTLFYDWHLSEEECLWLDNHPVIAIGCLKDAMPLCGIDLQRRPNGFIVDFVDLFKKALKINDITIYYKFYDDEDSLLQALIDEEVDTAFPVSFDLYQVEEDTLYISTPILRKLASFDGEITYETRKLSDHPYSNMVAFSATKLNAPFLDMVNRAKNYIPDETILTILNKYMPQETKLSLIDFVVDNIWYVLFFLVFIALIYIGFSYGNSERKKKNSAREELAVQKEMISQQANLFNQLIEDFDSVSIVNLDTGKKEQFSVRGAFSSFRNDLEKLTDYQSHVEYFADKIVFADDKKRYRQAMRRDKVIESLKTEPSYSINFRVNIKNTIMYYQSKIVRDPADVENNTVIIGIRNVDDEAKQAIRHRRLLEDAKNKAEVANKAKSSFLFNMSHDIRTPMNAIIGFTDMALQSKNNPEKVGDCLEKVKRSSDHLLKLVDDILDMARIENGKIELEESDADLIEVIKDLTSIIQGTAENKNIRFSLSLENITKTKIRIDVMRFNRVMINILSNAVKYTKSGGYVQFSVKQVSSPKNNSCFYEFVVADNGIGMTKDFVRHIYDSFSRERSSTISGVEGTGLGMSITKGLIDKMGGRITIKTQQRKGTTVFVKLPIKLQTENTEPDKAKNAALKKEIRTSFEGFRVLLVEDNLLNREIAKAVLEQKKLEVDIAEDGVVALDKLRNSAPDYYDLIFMDIQMPFMNGYTATRMIRQLKNDPHSEIPIIAMTANAFEEDKKRALEAGMNGHLTKPINTEELLKVLNDFLH